MPTEFWGRSPDRVFHGSDRPRAARHELAAQSSVAAAEVDCVVVLNKSYAGWISRLTIQACLPTCRPRANPYCSNSSTVPLNRNRA